MLGADKDKKERYEKIESTLGRQKLTPLQNIFGCYLASKVSCLGCLKVSWAIDFTYHFSISISNLDSREQIPPVLK